MTEAPAYPAVPTESVPSGGRLSTLAARVQSGTPPWVAPLAVLGCAGASLAYTELTHPTVSGAEAVPTCLVKLTTGFDCPGCGGTRAAWYLMHGDVAAAARHHLLFVFAVPFLIYAYIAWAGRVAFGWKLPPLRLSPAAMGWFLGAWAIFTVLRNLPWAPFTYLFV